MAKYRFRRSVNLFLRPTLFSHKKVQLMQAYIMLVHNNPKLPLVMTSLYLYSEPYATNSAFVMFFEISEPVY